MITNDKNNLKVYTHEDFIIKRYKDKSKINIKDELKIIIPKRLSNNYNYRIIIEEITYKISYNTIKTKRVTLEEKKESNLRDPSSYKGIIYYLKDRDKETLIKQAILCPIKYINTEERQISYKCIFKYIVKNNILQKVFSFCKYNNIVTIYNLSLEQLIKFNLKKEDLEKILKELKKGKYYKEIENIRFQEWINNKDLEINITNKATNKLI